MADILCVICLVKESPVETVAEVQIEGTLYCRDCATTVASSPRGRARLGIRSPRPVPAP